MLHHLGAHANASAGGSAFLMAAGGDVTPGLSVGQFGQGIVTEHNMPSRPGYQMVPLGAIHHPLSGTVGPKHILSQQADVLKEELLGYVNAIMERMDKGDAIKTMETF